MSTEHSHQLLTGTPNRKLSSVVMAKGRRTDYQKEINQLQLMRDAATHHNSINLFQSQLCLIGAQQIIHPYSWVPNAQLQPQQEPRRILQDSGQMPCNSETASIDVTGDQELSEVATTQSTLQNESTAPIQENDLLEKVPITIVDASKEAPTERDDLERGDLFKQSSKLKSSLEIPTAVAKENTETKRAKIEHGSKFDMLGESSTAPLVSSQGFSAPTQKKESFTSAIPQLGHQSESAEQHYYEEAVAYRIHNPPFPKNGLAQLAIVRGDGIPGNLSPVRSENLAPLPPSPPLPEFPSTGCCVWSYDKSTRVLLGNFRAPASKQGKIIVTRDDEEFLLKMMERDDITVISEGLGDTLQSSLFEQDYMRACIGSQYHHKVKSFHKIKTTPRNSVSTGESNGLYEETSWHSMRFDDYFDYLDIKREKGQPRKKSNFAFTDSEGRREKIDVDETVLYMLDVDMVKMLPRSYENFQQNFQLPGILPGGKHCMMNALNINGRPFMGPNVYITPREWDLTCLYNIVFHHI